MAVQVSRQAPLVLLDLEHSLVDSSTSGNITVTFATDRERGLLDTPNSIRTIFTCTLTISPSACATAHRHLIPKESVRG